MDIRKELLDILSDYIDLPGEEIDFNAPMKVSAGINSFVFLSIIASIEEHFDIRVPNGDIAGFKTLADLENYVRNKKA